MLLNKASFALVLHRKGLILNKRAKYPDLVSVEPEVPALQADWCMGLFIFFCLSLRYRGVMFPDKMLLMLQNHKIKLAWVYTFGF